MRFNANGNVAVDSVGASADASSGAAGSLGSAACRPGGGMCSRCAVCGLSEKLNVVGPVHNSGPSLAKPP